MLDVDVATGNIITNIKEVINSAIQITMRTPFESRIFNPRFGSGAHAMLQETIYDLISLQKIDAILTADIERALPDLTVRVTPTPQSNGDGTAYLLLKIDIKYKSESYSVTYSTDKWGFIN